MRSTYKTGRPKLPGDRYPSGKLKPVKPNPRVVEMRRALLGAKEGEAVDITKTESPIDLALARGWLSKERHAAAERFIRLYAGIRFPKERTSRDPADFATEAVAPGRRLAALDPDEDLILPMEWDLARAIEDADRDAAAGKITTAQRGHLISKANKAYLSAKMNWSNMPAADVNRLFDAVVMSARSSGAAPVHGAIPVVPGELREIWAVLKPEQAREIFSVCVLGRWPGWLLERIKGGLEAAPYRRRRRLLEGGLDRVIEHSKAKARVTTPSGSSRQAAYASPQPGIVVELRPRKSPAC